MTNVSPSRLSNFHEEVFVADGWELSPLLIQKNSWYSVIVRDYPDYIQCEWLSEAMKSKDISEIVYVSHGGDLLDANAIEKSPNDPSSICEKIFSLSTRCLALTSENLDFVLFKADDNSYYILAGSKEFMKIAYRASFQAVKVMFLDDLQYEKEVAQHKFKKLWNTYVAPYSSTGQFQKPR